MAPIARHAGRVTHDLKLVLRSLGPWRATLERLKGREVWVELHRVFAKATFNQHGWYRSTVLPLLAEEWGWGDVAELHYHLKWLHLPAIIPIERWPLRRIGNETRPEPPSAAEWSVEEFSAFLDRVLNQAKDSGIVVPPPRGSQERAA